MSENFNFIEFMERLLKIYLDSLKESNKKTDGPELLNEIGDQEIHRAGLKEINEH